MPRIRLIFLWHMHQPFYKDLVSGDYRLPWVRMHALKDYFGMVKMLDEFPDVHQNFNLVPSLITQIQDYVNGTAKDPFYDVAAKPAAELTPRERVFALRYLFQANHTHMISRYPRYRELHQKLRSVGEDPMKAEKYFLLQEIADLQVLSQLAWFDEYFMDDPRVAELVKKGRGYNRSDQQAMLAVQRDILASVLPQYASAAQRGTIEISTTPFYHPILPLLCDTNIGRVSTPQLPLPRRQFRHPEDAREQIQRALDFHQKAFGVAPAGMWPSEGSVSNEVIEIASHLGVKWMATDEGVLGRSLNAFFERDGTGHLQQAGANLLYNIYRYEQNEGSMHMVFRDHSLSDLIGFVYSGMPVRDAVQHFVRSIKDSARPVLNSGRDAVVSVILDGENAWEYYPYSGREFLRRLYDAIRQDAEIEPVTISEAIERHTGFARLESVTPGSWISANFNVWIGAPEDNLAWDYLSAARDFYSQHAPAASDAARSVAFEEILIAEGSDWNWWYGPEHHTANDRDFDELYRKHLSNVYQALGATPPDHLAQPIAGGRIATARVAPQTAYIRPQIESLTTGYFDWMGAASYVADRHGAAMHGREFLLRATYAGIDEKHLYARLDFIGDRVLGDYDIAVNIENVAKAGSEADRSVRVEIGIVNGSLGRSRVAEGNWIRKNGSANGLPANEENRDAGLIVTFNKILRLQLNLSYLNANQGDTLRLRFSIWRDRLPIDALPDEGWIEVPVVTEDELARMTDQVW
jgi:alpha-amylase/alpha-mannosidase (GH57 family)